MSLTWWDPTAQDTTLDTPGAYRWVWGGQRFKRGEIPTEPVPFLKDGVVMASEAEKYWAERGG
jgi:hypothetical protein